jgi:hypothetical protein
MKTRKNIDSPKRKSFERRSRNPDLLLMLLFLGTFDVHKRIELNALD